MHLFNRKERYDVTNCNTRPARFSTPASGATIDTGWQVDMVGRRKVGKIPAERQAGTEHHCLKIRRNLRAAAVIQMTITTHYVVV